MRLTINGREYRWDSAWTAARKTRYFDIPAGLTVWADGDPFTVPLTEDTPEARAACFAEAERILRERYSRREPAAIPDGMRECRWHGTVDYDHVCVRPGENADMATARAFGEIRDV